MKRRGMTRASLDVDAESLTGASASTNGPACTSSGVYDCYLKTL